MADPAAAPAPTPGEGVTLHLPSKYQEAEGAASTSPSQAARAQPDLDFLLRTWTVTHSTLSMWRTARNVHITYAALSPAADGRVRIDDLVGYESAKAATGARGKTVAGVDTQAAAGDLTSWDWRGKGLLFFVTSHWELLGFGTRTRPDGTVERWAVTWFSKTLFTQEGVDLYSDQPGGMGEETARLILDALGGLHPRIAVLTKDMRPVEIKLS